MNTGVRTYQRMTKAAKDVADKKPGAKIRLKAATKAYVDHVTKQAKKDAETKISDAKKKAAKVAGIGATKRKPAAKKTTKKATTAKRKSTRTTARKTR